MDYSIELILMDKAIAYVKSLFIPSDSNNFQPKLFHSRFLLYCAVLLLCLKIIFLISSVNLPINIFFADVTKTSLINLTNQSREMIGLDPLVESAKLDDAALLKAQDMVKNNYFSHQSPSGVTPWYWFSKTGYVYKYAGENLAVGFFESKDLYQAWLNSPAHKDNLLSPNYKEIGIAVVSGFGDKDAIVVVQLFGAPKTSVQKTVQNTQTTNTQTQVNESVQNKTEIVEENIAEENTNDETVVLPEVLSQSIKSLSFSEMVTEAKDNMYLRFMNFVSYGSEKAIQIAIYVFWVITVITLYFSLPTALNRENRHLLIRSVIIILLLSTAIMLNKETLSAIFPHQINI